MKFEKAVTNQTFDLQRGTFEGLATSGKAVDRQGEVLDYPSSKDAFLRWSDAVYRASAGRSRGNLREMHDPHTAIGYCTRIDADDARQEISIAGRVVDPNALVKLDTGTLNSLSIGGTYGRRWRDAATGATRYQVSEICEISLVDFPALPEASITVLKRNGITEVRKFGRRDRDGAGQFAAPMDADLHQELTSRGFKLRQGSRTHYHNPETGHQVVVPGSTPKGASWGSFAPGHPPAAGVGREPLAAHLNSLKRVSKEAKRLQEFLPYRGADGGGLTAREAAQFITGRANLPPVTKSQVDGVAGLIRDVAAMAEKRRSILIVPWR